MIIVKDLDKLKDYGFELDDWGDYKVWSYDCGDNQTYVVVQDDHELAIHPTYVGDCPADYFDHQLDIIARLILDGVATLEAQQ